MKIFCGTCTTPSHITKMLGTFNFQGTELGGFTGTNSQVDSDCIDYGSQSPQTAGIYTKQTTGSRHFRKVLIFLLISAKICKAISIFILSSLFASISSPNILNEEPTRALNTYSVSEEAFATNIHAPPVAVFGRWSATIQILTFVQISSGIIQAIFARLTYKMLNNGAGAGPPMSIPIWPVITRFIPTIASHSSHNRILNTVLHSVGSTMLILLWVSALQLCGPFRTLLCMGPYYEFTIAGIVSSFLIFKSGAKLRGTVLFGAGIVILLVSERPIHSSNSFTNHEVENLDSISKNTIGIFMLLACCMLKYLFNTMSKRNCTHSGEMLSSANSTFISGIGLLLMTFADFLDGADMIASNLSTVMLATLVSFGLTMDQLIDSICSRKIEGHKIARIGAVATLTSALILNFILSNSSPDLTPMGAVGAYVTICLATINLTRPETVTGQGSFVGYSADGMPLLSFSTNNLDQVKSSSVEFFLMCYNSVRKEIRTNTTSGWIFKLFVIHLLLTVVELSYGCSINSSTLVADSIFKLFQTVVLVILMNSIVASRMKPTKMNLLGIGSQEVLYSFTVALTALVISIGLILNTLRSLVTIFSSNSGPPFNFDNDNAEAETELTNGTIMMLTAVISLNVIAIYFIQMCPLDNHLYFSTIKTAKGFRELITSYTFRNTLIIASLLFHGYNWKTIDCLCSIVISGASIRIFYPVFKNNIRILLLSIPPGSEKDIQHVLLQILAMEGVLSYNRHRFWVHSPAVYTGSIHLHATNEANEQKLIRDVNNLFLAVGFIHFTVQVEKDQFIQSRSANVAPSTSDIFTKSDSNFNISFN